MTRVFTGIWLAAISLAAAIALALSHGGWASKAGGSAGPLPSLDGADIVFIGSSLVGIAMPPGKPVHGKLGDNRTSAVISVNGISEQLSNYLLGHALDSGARVIFLEINAYAHDYADPSEPPLLWPFVASIRQMGTRERDNLKALMRSYPQPGEVVRLGAYVPNGTLDAARLSPTDYYSFVKIEPTQGEELRALLARARDAGVEVFFYWPPRPKSLVKKLKAGEFEKLLSHIRHIAASYKVPVWHSESAWPDDHFSDILAHTNARGRERFRRELPQWYKAKK